MKYTMYFAGLIACFFSIVAAQAQESKFLNSPARKLQLAEFAIANLYVDEVNEGKLVEEAIVKMLEQLDPHSTYTDTFEVSLQRLVHSLHFLRIRIGRMRCV